MSFKRQCKSWKRLVEPDFFSHAKAQAPSVKSQSKLQNRCFSVFAWIILEIMPAGWAILFLLLIFVLCNHHESSSKVVTSETQSPPVCLKWNRRMKTKVNRWCLCSHKYSCTCKMYVDSPGRRGWVAHGGFFCDLSWSLHTHAGLSALLCSRQIQTKAELQIFDLRYFLICWLFYIYSDR